MHSKVNGDIIRRAIFLGRNRGSFMRRIVFLSLAGLLVAGAELGEDFWVKKDYLQWTDEEVKTLLTNSPWAKDVTITIPPSVLARGGGQGRGGAGGSGGGGGA